MYVAATSMYACSEREHPNRGRALVLRSLKIPRLGCRGRGGQPNERLALVSVVGVSSIEAWVFCISSPREPTK